MHRAAASKAEPGQAGSTQGRAVAGRLLLRPRHSKQAPIKAEPQQAVSTQGKDTAGRIPQKAGSTQGKDTAGRIPLKAEPPADRFPLKAEPQQAPHALTSVTYSQASLPSRNRKRKMIKQKTTKVLNRGHSD